MGIIFWPGLTLSGLSLNEILLQVRLLIGASRLYIGISVIIIIIHI